MSEMNDKQALKALREKRAATIEHAREQVKVQNRWIKQIKEQIKGQAKTVPEIAQATSIPTDRVLWLISSLKKYGIVIEGDKDGSYFRYVLSGTEEAS